MESLVGRNYMYNDGTPSNGASVVITMFSLHHQRDDREKTRYSLLRGDVSKDGLPRGVKRQRHLTTNEKPRSASTKPIGCAARSVSIGSAKSASLSLAHLDRKAFLAEGFDLLAC